MATYTEILNSVLRRMRESQIASPGDTEYALMLGELVNETKREVEDAWKWNALRTLKTVSAVQGTNKYAITGAGKRYRLQDTWDSVYNATEEYGLEWRPSMWMKEQIIIHTDQAQPSYYYFEGFDSSGDPYVYLHSTPDASYTINFSLIIPQADLSAGGTVLTVPEWPVILGTYAKAIAERGEDSGRTHGEALSKYQSALTDAVAIDESLVLNETTWYA